MKNYLVVLYCVASVILIGYVAIWWGIIEPIIAIAEMIDTDTLTATGVAWEVCKFFLREIVTGIVVVILYGLGLSFLDISLNSFNKK